jgi:flagellar biosynthesis anti-sigma factor FlgM
MTNANEQTTQIKQEIDVVERKDHLSSPIPNPGSPVAQKKSPEVLRQVTLAREALRQVPEIRADRVERVRAQIEAGTYQVDSTLIARKLLGLPAREDATPTLPE